MAADTIFALSSGALPAGVAIIRLSGPHALSAAQLLTHSHDDLTPRKAYLKTIRCRNGLLIDSGLLLYFPGPNSFTGEDCIEFQVHGSRAVVDAIFAELTNIDGLRAAEAGDFSKRAFDNGKMDLVEVEGLADLLQAETEMQRRLAVEQASGKLSQLYDGWAQKLTKSRALIEAELDFADEDDVPGSVSERVWRDVEALYDDITIHLSQSAHAEIMRDGFKIALLGPPNVGKSTLMNSLSGRDVAIVTDIAGTTRDVLSVDMNIDGNFVRMFDTAGIRDTTDVVESEGIRRALAHAEAADLVLMLTSFDSGSKQIDEKLNNPERLHVVTKCDLQPLFDDSRETVSISAKIGTGLDELRAKISEILKQRLGNAPTLAPVRARHKNRLEETLHYVSEALKSEGSELEIRSEYLRLAANSLGRITGRVDVEDLLGIIFSEFCIGK
jgi:tRNA modification GTPase